MRRPRGDGFFSSRRRHTRYWRDWSSDVCSSDLNNFVYVHYTQDAPGTTPSHNRVVRFTASGDRAVMSSEKLILRLNNLSDKRNHNGGALNFGEDGKLYVAVGENGEPDNAQSLNNLLGKMLRINKDRKSTRLNSSHANISYAVFCLKKKKNILLIFTLLKSQTALNLISVPYLPIAYLNISPCLKSRSSVTTRHLFRILFLCPSPPYR